MTGEKVNSVVIKNIKSAVKQSCIQCMFFEINASVSFFGDFLFIRSIPPVPESWKLGSSPLLVILLTFSRFPVLT